jgi:hypothetical protein
MSLIQDWRRFKGDLDCSTIPAPVSEANVSEDGGKSDLDNKYIGQIVLNLNKIFESNQLVVMHSCSQDQI